jgi:hypothetical protein
MSVHQVLNGWLEYRQEFSRDYTKVKFLSNPPKISSGWKKNKTRLRKPVFLPDLIKLQVFHLFKASYPRVNDYEAYRIIYCFVNAFVALSATGDLNKN